MQLFDIRYHNTASPIHITHCVPLCFVHGAICEKHADHLDAHASGLQNSFMRIKDADIVVVGCRRLPIREHEEDALPLCAPQQPLRHLANREAIAIVLLRLQLHQSRAATGREAGAEVHRNLEQVRRLLLRDAVRVLPESHNFMGDSQVSRGSRGIARDRAWFRPFCHTWTPSSRRAARTLRRAGVPARASYRRGAAALA